MSAPSNQLVFRASLAVIALDVLDESFWHRQPGTSAADHLSQGLAPAAVALVLILAYPRLKDGWRGVAAVVCGALAVVAGVTAGRVLSAVAGVVLLALGAVVLWRSRRRTIPRRLLAGAAGALAAFFLVLPLGLSVVVNHKPRADVVAADLGRPYEPVTLRTSDGLDLAAWYVPSVNGAAVIAFPGRSQPVPAARMLARHGYGVLLLDPRGTGDSDGDVNRRGWAGEPDLRAAIAYLQDRPDVDRGRIGGLGLSVGGELLLQTAAHTRGLRAVVSDGAGIRSLAEQMHNPDAPAPIRWMSTDLVETAASVVLTGVTPPPDLVDLMPDISPGAVLLIRAVHGNPDERLNEVYFDAAREPKQLWTAPRGGHAGVLSAMPDEYERRVVGFFDRYLAAAPQAGRSE